MSSGRFLTTLSTAASEASKSSSTSSGELKLLAKRAARNRT
jgi:hypothetical protein